MTILYIIGGIFALAFLIFFVIGLSMKKEHKISRNIFIKSPLEKVWDTVTDTVRQIEWRSDLQKIELKESADGHLVWAEIPKAGAGTTQRVIRSQENKIFETETLLTSIYTGHSTAEFSRSQAGTTLRITASIRVDSPLKRPFSKMADKLESGTNLYQDDLKKYLEAS